MARHARESVLAAATGAAALESLVRLFLGRGGGAPDVVFKEAMLWPAYTAHAWKRGAKTSILQGLERMRSVFQLALERAGVPLAEAAERANSVHNYLLGAMVRNLIEPIGQAEVARAISALSGIAVNPKRC